MKLFTDNSPQTGHLLLLLVALSILLINTLPRLGAHLGQDELHWFYAGKSLAETGKATQFNNPQSPAVWSPHLTAFSIAASLKLFGTSVFNGRLQGMICWLLAIGLIYKITSKYASPKAAGLSALLAASIPLSSQAGAIVDVDNTVMVPIVILLTYQAVCFLKDKSWVQAWKLGLILALSMWARLPTPLLFILFFSIFCIFIDRSFRFILKVFSAILAGFIIFSVTWGFYCIFSQTPFWGHVEYTFYALNSCTTGSRGFSLLHLFKNIVYAALWTGPLTFILFFLSAASTAWSALNKKILKPEYFFIFFGIIILIGYSIVGGAIFGFPKYHCPAIPLICIGIGISFHDKLSTAAHSNYYLCGVFALLLTVVTYKDPLYFIRMTMRVQQAAGIFSTKSLLKEFCLPLFSTMMLITISGTLLYKYRAMSKPILIFFFSVVGFTIGISVNQHLGRYNTGYNYGDSGEVSRIANLLKPFEAEGRRVIAPGEIIELLQPTHSSHIKNSVWTDPSLLLPLLKQKDVSAFCYTISCNSATQIQFINNSDAIQSHLSTHFYKLEHEPSYVWIRKGQTSNDS